MLLRLHRLPSTVRCLVLSMVLVMTASAPPPDSGTPASSPSPTSPDTTVQAPEGFDLQGHRGARGLAPENTIPAFRKALDLGVTTLELDVVISGDGQVVVSHEPWMSHEICTTPDGTPVPEAEERNHNLFDMTYAQIEAYDCGTRRHARFPEQELQAVAKPLLRDVIEMAEAYASRQREAPVFYNVETKIRPSWEGTFTPGPEAFADAVIEVLRTTGVAARATLQSFDPRTLMVARMRQAPVRLALLVAASRDQGVEQNLEMLPFSPHIYSPDFTLVDADLIAAAHDHGMQVVPWTVNEVEDMQRLVDLGVDGLITDYPDRAVAAVGDALDTRSEASDTED